MIKPENTCLQHCFRFLLGFIFFGAITSAGYAQFIDLQLNIDPEIVARTEQPLNFDTLATNSGRQMIELGSINMGIFSITALENQMLLVTLDKPAELKHEDASIDDSIPLELYSRYGYSIQNYDNSYPLPETTGNIKVEPNSAPGLWNSVYIFMYGEIEIGDVSGGTYSSEIVLIVEYI